MTRYLALLAFSVTLHAAASYRVERTTDHGVEVVRLKDQQHGVEVSIVPSVGNRVYEMKVHGKNLLYFPLPDIAAFKNSGGRGMNGIPFLAPWANRMAGSGFWANDKRYTFNGDLGSVHLDANGIAIHGMLLATPLWEIEKLTADRRSARLISRLPFWKYPDLMANWPFAHEYEMTFTLTNGVLEVSTAIKNLSASPMPVMIGFHPYFNIPGVPRAECSIHLPVRKHIETDAHLVATGEMTPVNFPDRISLKDRTFDDGFTDIVRGSDGNAVFSVEAGEKKIEVTYGPKYQVAVIYAPPHQNYVCFEPMAAITNGVNLAHDGKYPALQSVAPGATWREDFWIRGAGF